MSNCTLRQTENNFLRWTRVYGTFSIQDMQAAGGIPAGCNPADVSPIINLTATSGVSEVTLNWTNTSSSQTGVYVYRSTSSGFTPNAGNLLATLGDVETYSDTSATAGTTYYYVVVGFNDEGESTPSNEASGQIFDAFQITVKTDNTGTSANDKYRLPVRNVFQADYDFDVYYNGAIIASGDNTDKSTGYVELTFSDGAGTKQIAIVGTYTGWDFDSTGDRNKLISVDAWGEAQPIGTNLSSQFANCGELTTVASGLIITEPITIDLEALFRNCPKFNPPVGTFDDWDLGVNNTGRRIFEDNLVFNSRIDSFLTSSLIRADSFLFDAALWNQPLGSGIDTSNIANFRFMFADTSYTGDGVENLDFTSATSLNEIFRNCTLTNNNYALLLGRLTATLVNTGLSLGVGNSKYTADQTFSGTTNGTTPNELVDSLTNFTSGTAVQVGDVVYNTTDGTFARVTDITNAASGRLVLDADIMVSGEGYSIQTSQAAKDKAELILDFNLTITDGGYDI